MSTEQKSSNGALGKILSQLDLPTLVIVLLMGGSNFLETRNGNNVNAQEIQRATNEIHELYPKLMQAIGNQNDMLKSNAKQLENQRALLDNQKQMLETLQKQQQQRNNGDY